jgi:tRNA 2-thiouridine synthesizing protein A
LRYDRHRPIVKHRNRSGLCDFFSTASFGGTIRPGGHHLTDDGIVGRIGSAPPVGAPPDQVVEACGLLCPLPLVKVARVIGAPPAGTLFELRSDDPAALADVPAWCAARRHDYLGVCRQGTVLRFFFRKGSG